MENNKILYWIVQFTAWGILCGIIGIATFVQEDFDKQTGFKLLELYILLILSSHFIRWIFINKNWLNLKLGPLTPRVMGLSFLLSLLLILVVNLSSVYFYQEKWFTLSAILVNSLLYSLFLIMWSAVYLTYHLLQKSRLQELNNLRLQTSQTRHELKVLHDQLNPHFLFNSLNNIRALIEIEPDTAKSAITNLSNLLRSSLLLGKKSFITLQEELQLVQEYLKLEKIRYEERLIYTLKSEINETVYIPPFLIQGMVENAIKHGISKNIQGGEINIQIKYENENIILKVINDGSYNKNNTTGIGITNTKRRLEIVYKNFAGFDIKNVEGKVHSYIWINKEQLKNKHNESNNH